MNFKVKFMRQMTSPIQSFDATRELGSASVRLDGLLDIHMQCFEGVRIFNAESLAALLKACRGGVFGRGSLLRFHMAVYYPRYLTVFPLFVGGGDLVGSVPNHEGFSRLPWSV